MVSQGTALTVLVSMNGSSVACGSSTSTANTPVGHFVRATLAEVLALFLQKSFWISGGQKLGIDGASEVWGMRIKHNRFTTTQALSDCALV